MPHPRVQSHRTTYQRRAASLRAQLQAAERAQLADPNLSPAQRRRNVRHLRDQATRQLGQLRAEYEAGKPAVLQAIVGHLYRLPPQVGADVSWRDALDRVTHMDDQDTALREMNLARMVGDTIMVQAIAYMAAPDPVQHPPKWPAVIAVWRHNDPQVAGTLAEFDEAWAELNDANQRFEDAALFQLPAEQRGPDPDSLPQLQPVPDQPSE